MTANQSQFSLTVQTNSFFVNAFELSDHGLSKHYSVKIQLSSDQPINLTSLINQTACLNIADENYLHGVIADCQTNGKTPDGKKYIANIVLVSPLFHLTQNLNSQLFLQQTLPDVIQQLLQSAGINKIQFKVQNNYVAHQLFMQYNESDFNFMSRLCERFGLFYYFQQSKSGYELVFVDDIQQLPTAVDDVSCELPSGQAVNQKSVFSLQMEQQLLVQNFILRDYCIESPGKACLFESQQQANKTIKGCGTEMIYLPGIVNEQEGRSLVNIAQQSIDWQRKIVFACSDYSHLQPGQLISISHPSFSLYNGSYRIIAIDHKGNQNPGQIYSSGVDDDFLKGRRYANQLQLIPADVPFRAAQIHNNFITDVVPAVIEGNSDSAYLDEYGRYKIRFHFDRSDRPKAQASPWLRKIEHLSGQHYGMHFPLLPGTEVSVAFVGGNPDRPIIWQAMANTNKPTPVTSQNPWENRLQTKSGHALVLSDLEQQAFAALQTNQALNQLKLSAKQGDHHISAISKQGEIAISAKKNLHKQAGTDISQSIGRNHQVTIKQSYQAKAGENDLTEQANNIFHVTHGNHRITAEQGDINIKVGENINANITDFTRLWLRQGDLTWINDGSLAVKVNGGIVISGHGNGPITLSQAGAKIEIDTKGNITVQAKQVDFIADNTNFQAAQSELAG